MSVREASSLDPPSVPKSRGIQRCLNLDVLRGVAIGLVLLTHAPRPEWTDPMRAPWYDRLLEFGSSGVDLFFVLSGFLIGGLLFAEIGRTQTVEVKRFFLRRGFKIWPSYFAVYGLVAAITFASLTSKSGLRNALSSMLPMWPNLVFLQNYVNMETRWFATWSLAVEEHFYLVAPILLSISFFHRSFSSRKLVAIALVCLFIPALLRTIAFAHNHVDQAYLQTHMRFDGLALGVLAAWLRRMDPTAFDRFRTHASRMRWALIPVFAFWVFAPPQWTLLPLVRSLKHTALAGVYLCWVTSTAYMSSSAPLFGRAPRIRHWLSTLGTYSYTTYLAQALAKFPTAVATRVLARRLAPDSWASYTLLWGVFIVTSIVVGYGASLLVELPALRLRERWLPSSRSTAV